MKFHKSGRYLVAARYQNSQMREWIWRSNYCVHLQTEVCRHVVSGLRQLPS
jgi:hypothetical protein